MQHALDRASEVVAVCREVSVYKLEEFSGRITIIPGATDGRQVIERAVADCDAVLKVLVPRGIQHFPREHQAVLDLARPGARLVFSRRLAGDRRAEHALADRPTGTAW